MKMPIAAIMFTAVLAGYGILGNGITPAAAQSFNERGPSLSETAAVKPNRPIRYNTNTYNATYGPRDLRGVRDQRRAGIYADTAVVGSFNMRTVPSSENVFPSSDQRRVLRPFRRKECEIVTGVGFNERTSLQTIC